MGWLSQGVDVTAFTRPFKGTFSGLKFDSTAPPRQVVSNHQSCAAFSDFISDTIQSRVATGAVRVWGKDPRWILHGLCYPSW
jgi:hypothetical protein